MYINHFNYFTFKEMLMALENYQTCRFSKYGLNTQIQTLFHNSFILNCIKLQIKCLKTD